jgi:hypothetical protein
VNLVVTAGKTPFQSIAIKNILRGYYSTQNTKNCLINQLAHLLNRNRMPW